MGTRGFLRLVSASASAGLAASLLLVAPAAATTDEPTVSAVAWYWEDAKSQEITVAGNSVTVETPSPFCPQGPSATGAPPQACAEGRLPVEVQNGDYETPNKVSAVAFDLFTVPPGSTITEFTVTFLEAESGCTQQGNNPDDVKCEQTDPANLSEDTKLEACVVNEVFGDGDARQYKELPRFTCTPGTDPVAERKEIETKKDDETDQTPDHVWTFDLTAFAQQWSDASAGATAILLTPSPPEQQDNPADNWRVVLAGPKVENGVVTKIVFTAPEDDTTTTTTTTTTGGGGTTTTTFGDSGSTSVDSGGSFGGTGTGTGSTDETEEPVDAEEEQTNAVEPTPVQNFPWYMWVAIAAGIAGFSLVRRTVVESVGGVRPDGVLAQIRAINASRRGESIESADATGGGVLAAATGGLKSAGSKIAGIAGKLIPKRGAS